MPQSTGHHGPITTDQPGPQANFCEHFREQVYEHSLIPGPDGRVPVALVNPNYPWENGGSGLGFLLEYDSRQLPAFYQWQNLQGAITS